MVDGVAALHARFAKVPEIVRAEVVAELEKQAEIIVKEIRQLAPRDQGDIIAGIGWTWGDAPVGSLKIGKVAGREFGRIAITIYAGRTDKDFYAKYHEFGTIKMAARPFFFPVFRANRSRVRGALSRAVTRGVKKA